MTVIPNPHMYIGPAGWHYKDWHGIVYPRRAATGLQELPYLADFFNIVEINSTFYKIPSVDSVQSWLQLVKNKQDFLFCLKLFQRFTHANLPYSKEEITSFSRILEIVQRENRLAALLIQFPWRFKQTPDNFAKVLKLVAAFRNFPCAVEFRHVGWMTNDTLKILQDHQIAFVNIDEPPHNHSLPLSTVVTANFGYVRLHGRNAEMWFNENSETAQRYNYLYNDLELNSIIDTIKEIRDKTGNLFIIFNNHYRGQAVVNAFQLMAKLSSQPLLIPATLLEFYPQLKSIQRINKNEQLSFF